MPSSLNGTYVKVFMDKSDLLILKYLCVCLQHFVSLAPKGLFLWAADDSWFPRAPC